MNSKTRVWVYLWIYIAESFKTNIWRNVLYSEILNCLWYIFHPILILLVSFGVFENNPLSILFSSMADLDCLLTFCKITDFQRVSVGISIAVLYCRDLFPVYFCLVYLLTWDEMIVSCLIFFPCSSWKILVVMSLISF